MGYNAPKQTVSQFQLKGRCARQIAHKEPYKSLGVPVKYFDTLIQIWHYYVMAENMDVTAKKQLFSAYTQGSIMLTQQRYK